MENATLVEEPRDILVRVAGMIKSLSMIFEP
jgi:hypothetical protein